MVSPRDNAWHTNYWLTHCLDGKQTLIVSLSNSEGNDFPIGSMVIKGEYLTQVSQAWKKKGYVFEDYRPGKIVYHYTNLVIGTNLQLQTMPNKNSSKSQYLLPYSEHERLKDTIGIRGDPGGVVQWPQVGSHVCSMHGIFVLCYKYVMYMYMSWFWFHGLIYYLEIDRLTTW